MLVGYDAKELAPRGKARDDRGMTDIELAKRMASLTARMAFEAMEHAHRFATGKPTTLEQRDVFIAAIKRHLLEVWPEIRPESFEGLDQPPSPPPPATPSSPDE